MDRPAPAMGTQDDVVGERILAFLLDQFVVLVLAVVLGLALGGLFRSRGAAVLGVLFVVFGYHFLLEGLFGQTVGKRLLDLVVVDEHGRHIGLGTSFLRNLLRIVDGLFYWAVGLAAMLLTDDRQRLGDLAADTVVVSTSESTGSVSRGRRRRSTV